MRLHIPAFLLLVTGLFMACPGPTDPDGGTPSEAESPTPTGTPTVPEMVQVQVDLDGAPVAGATVMQGGGEIREMTDANGEASIEIDRGVEGDKAIVVTHPDARASGLNVPRDGGAMSFELTSFDRSDNEDYVFQDPGEPDRRASTGQCGHCHISINQDWDESMHKESASRETLHDLYAGAAAALNDATSCADAGGLWTSGPEPGTGAMVDRCFLGEGVIASLNADCASGMDCSSPPTAFGGCADCHAPGIDGALGGRDLHEATGFAYDYGVHCDVCHKTESINLAAEPGVAGRMRVLRPSEPSNSPGIGEWLPIMFGPYQDVANAFMGAVPREHFLDGSMCAGCHQQEQEVLVVGESLDLGRWPSARMPIHTTYAEWQGSNFSPTRPCNDCHMPPDTEAGNSADLGNLVDIEPGIVGGWHRTSGEIRRHEWLGPRSADGTLFVTALRLQLAVEHIGNDLTVTATISNTGAGHAVPTGEPMRSVVLVVDVNCGGVSQPAVGGTAVPDFGGALAMQDSSGDWSQWPGAQLGQVVRVVSRPGTYYNYSGFGPFGDGTFNDVEKGMPVEEVVGFSTIVDVQGNTVTFDSPLPAGDIAYRVEPADWPSQGTPAGAWAGAPGYAFARVLADANGNRMVPHYLATDVVSDNRLLPGAGTGSVHDFVVSCPTPEVRGILVHRGYPYDLALERGWSNIDAVMTEVVQ